MKSGISSTPKKTREECQGRAGRCWRRVDVDRDRRRHEAAVSWLVADRTTDAAVHLHGRSCRAACQSRAANE